MAMNAATLSADIKARLLANGDSQAQDNDALTALCDEIAAAVVAHIVANAQVAVTVTSVSGVTIGTQSSGPGTGTGTIT